MKILYAQCGLGNQMFQYAYLKYLQQKGYDDIWIDASAPSMHKHTGFELFRIFPNIAASQRLLPYWKGRMLHLWSDILKKGLGYSLETEGEGPDRAVIPSGKKWLRGYWQEARFAEAVRRELLHDFVMSEPQDAENRRLLAEMEQGEAVSVHVRAGDYLEPEGRIVFGDICSADYYQQAIEQLRKAVPNPVFFVFSNDPEWAKGYLNLGEDAIFVDHNRGAESFRDLQLMSRCKHHILANSSFSWWGAWLNPSSKKKVYAPPKWFHNHPESFTAGIIPKGWITVGEAKPFVSLIAPEEIPVSDLERLLSQRYGDFELHTTSKSGDKRVRPLNEVPHGIYRLEISSGEYPSFGHKKYLEQRLIRLMSEQHPNR